MMEQDEDIVALKRNFDLVDCWKTLLFGLSFFHSII
jgi:hypothetical protein